jgi:hypothetical protein
MSVSFGPKDAEMLPRSLEEVNFHGIHHISEEWCISILNAMPKNIKRLGGIFPKKPTLAVARHLPRTLLQFSADERFSGDPDVSMPPDVIEGLPDSMAQLSVGAGDYSKILHFPKELRTLKMENIRFSSSSSKEQQQLAGNNGIGLGIGIGSVNDTLERLIKQIPKDVKVLSLNFLSRENDPITGELATLLPRSLKELTWKAGDPMGADPNAVFKALPLTLTSLSIEHNHVLIDRTTRRIKPPPGSSLLIPRSIVSLHIGACLEFDAQKKGKMSQWILGLPKSLVVLSLTFSRAQRGIFNSFGEFNNLEDLCIKSLNPPKDGWSKCAEVNLQSLPRSLTRFSFSSFSGEPNCQQSDLTNDFFEGAPAYLTSLQIPISPLLTRACLVHHLPNVRFLSFSNGVMPPFQADFSRSDMFQITSGEKSVEL